jgi:glycosyltransferase involved in cell wall biosynthesis
MMLNAFSLLLKDHPDTVLIIVGDGEERTNIENKIKQLNIKDSVILPGYDPQPQHYLALMDIFLLSSLSEGTSMTLLEAMSLGKPCVVTDAGGNPEIIKHQYNGMVTANHNPNEFSQALNHLLQDVKCHSDMSSNALKRFDSMFASHMMIDIYRARYEQFSGRQK